ncbi:hypothetical protein NPIL_362451 [Nephila pilipes]|uniref:Uncharacterized protein n=1 Tax=Nephila pilipes TaxID=299642 RepID=A0A8X6P177_NEPPI|nr:hypothetical protein NPIL_362451 [Nephila pilipes]
MILISLWRFLRTFQLSKVGIVKQRFGVPSENPQVILLFLEEKRARVQVFNPSLMVNVNIFSTEPVRLLTISPSDGDIWGRCLTVQESWAIVSSLDVKSSKTVYTKQRSESIAILGIQLYPKSIQSRWSGFDELAGRCMMSFTSFLTNVFHFL